MYPRMSCAAAVLCAAIAFAPGVAAQQPAAPMPADPARSTQPQPVAPNTSGPQTPQPVGTSGRTAPAPPSTPCTPADVSTALPLLDRVQWLLEGAVKDQLGKVEIDRGTIDEMRAEIAQIKAAIQPVRRP